jgi:hypothetical protein
MKKQRRANLFFTLHESQYVITANRPGGGWVYFSKKENPKSLAQ